MDVLKKIRGATLIESLTATVLIVIVFMMASLILNNIFSTTIRKEDNVLKNRLRELEYSYIQEELKLPYKENFETWDIQILLENEKVKVYYKKEGKESEKELTWLIIE